MVDFNNFNVLVRFLTAVNVRITLCGIVILYIRAFGIDIVTARFVI